MKGAPNISNGLVVPLPSEMFVPSSRHMPGYTRAVSSVGMLGEGMTQGRPVWSNHIFRFHFCIVMTRKSRPG